MHEVLLDPKQAHGGELHYRVHHGGDTPLSHNVGEICSETVRFKVELMHASYGGTSFRWYTLSPTWQPSLEHRLIEMGVDLQRTEDELLSSQREVRALKATVKQLQNTWWRRLVRWLSRKAPAHG